MTAFVIHIPELAGTFHVKKNAFLDVNFYHY